MYTIIAATAPFLIGWYLMKGHADSDTISNDAVNSGHRVITTIVFLIALLASNVFHFGTYHKPMSEKFLFFKFHKL